MDKVFANAFVGLFNVGCQCQKDSISHQIYCKDCDIICCYDCFANGHFEHNITDVLSALQCVSRQLAIDANQVNTEYDEMFKANTELFILAAMLYDTAGANTSQYKPQLNINSSQFQLPFIKYVNGLDIDYHQLMNIYKHNCVSALRQQHQLYKEIAEKELQRIRNFKHLTPKNVGDKLTCIKQLMKCWNEGLFEGDPKQVIDTISAILF